MPRSVSTVLGSIGLLIIAGGNLPPLACAGPSGDRSGPRPPALAEEPADPARVGAALEGVQRAAPGERRGAVLDLVRLGPGALSQVRRARDGAGDPAVREALDQAARWLVAARLKPVLAERAATGLSFEGQYSDLKAGDPETVAALVDLLDDEETPPGLRVAAAHALADLRDTPILGRLGGIEDDPLLRADVREEVGILMAILGDTGRMDSQVRRLVFELEKKSLNPLEKIDTNEELSNLYYRIRNYKKAIECYDRAIAILDALRSSRLAARSPELQRRLTVRLAGICYNAACSLSLNGEVERARAMIKKAVEHDLKNLKNLEKDGDLRNVREAPGYQKFREELEKPLKDKSI